MTEGFERAELSDFLGDSIVYRNLEPADGRLRGLKEIWSEIGMPAYRIPRKVEAEYAATVLHILGQARDLRGQTQPSERLLYIGDTRLLDGTAFRNLRAASGWPGWAFIASEDMAAEPRVIIEDDLYLANRWSALAGFLDFVREKGLSLDGRTVTVIDLDKTTLGARGRNDRAVDAARVDGVRRTVQEALGGEFDAQAFRSVYDELNQPRYHSFTADNQDVLAYVCMMVVSGLYDYQTLLEAIDANRLSTFDDFIEACQEILEQPQAGTAALQQMHAEVYGNYKQGDPTPFKSFRRREYLTTIARMDSLPDDAPVNRLLQEEITLTREVAEAALWLKARGVLCFGISDKPDEASLPTPAQTEAGRLPLHRTRMKVLGTRLQLTDIE